MAVRKFALLILVAMLAGAGAAQAAEGETARKIVYKKQPDAPRVQTPKEAEAKSAGCTSCHTATDSASMHTAEGVMLGCADCHGGDATIAVPAGAKKGDPAYFAAQQKAHVLPRYPIAWHYPASANPPRTYTLLNREAPEYIRFINPSDLRVARESCGACHLPIIQAAERSMMATGALLWGGAAYNNNILPFKNYLAGESYTREGVPAIIKSPGEMDQQKLKRGVIPQMVPLPTWETMPPGDIFRVFERGGRNIITQFPEIGNPNSLGQLQRLEEPGRPDIRQSNRAEATACASRCRSSTSTSRASTIRSPGSSAPTTSPAITAPRAAALATWSMPTTATRAIPASTPSSGTTARRKAPIPPSRAARRAIR